MARGGLPSIFTGVLFVKYQSSISILIITIQRMQEQPSQQEVKEQYQSSRDRTDVSLIQDQDEEEISKGAVKEMCSKLLDLYVNLHMRGSEKDRERERERERERDKEKDRENKAILDRLVLLEQKLEALMAEPRSKPIEALPIEAPVVETQPVLALPVVKELEKQPCEPVQQRNSKPKQENETNLSLPNTSANGLVENINTYFRVKTEHTKKQKGYKMENWEREAKEEIEEDDEYNQLRRIDRRRPETKSSSKPNPKQENNGEPQINKRILYKMKHLKYLMEDKMQRGHVGPIPSYIDTGSGYLCCFRFEGNVITLQQQPIEIDPRPVMLLTTFPIDRSKAVHTFAIRVIAHRLTSSFGFGVVDIKHRKKKFCKNKDRFVKLNSKGYVMSGRESYRELLLQLVPGDILIMNVLVELGIVEWRKKTDDIEHTIASCNSPEIQSESITWVPFIDMKSIGDSIQWLL